MHIKTLFFIYASIHMGKIVQNLYMGNVVNKLRKMLICHCTKSWFLAVIIVKAGSGKDRGKKIRKKQKDNILFRDEKEHSIKKGKANRVVCLTVNEHGFELSRSIRQLFRQFSFEFFAFIFYFLYILGEIF